MCLFFPSLKAADVNLLPLSGTKLILAPNSTKNIVKYVIFNSSATTNYNLVLTAKRGLTALTGVGYCGSAFTLAKKKSCILVIKINAAKMANPTKGGPTVCKKEALTACFSPSEKDQLLLTRDTIVSFKPLSPIKLTVPANRTAKLYYLIRNLNKEPVQLSMKAIPGIKSLSGIRGTVPYCGTNPKLNKAKTCLLVLEITGSKIASKITTGPFLCIQGTTRCFQPQVGKRLSISKGATTGLAAIEAVEVFPISVAQSGTVQLNIKNTSPVIANNIKALLTGVLGDGLQQTPAQCAPLARDQICTLTFTAATNLVVGTHLFTLKGSNTNTINGQVQVTNGNVVTNPPTIVLITPHTGSQQGNETITLTGTNLQPNPNVYLGNKQSTVVDGNDTVLLVKTPAQFSGFSVDTSVDVRVLTDNGEVIVNNGFTYLAAAASCSDGIKNGNESDTDCGTNCSPCQIGDSCFVDSDCTSSTSFCANEVCVANPQCGDGNVTGNEQCDGYNLAAKNCSVLGFTGGTLACSSTCAFDISGCSTCGDGNITGTEACDDGNTFNGDGCSSICTVSPGFNCTGQPSMCDLDECSTNNGGCDVNATCTDIIGSNTCACSPGYTGNGTSRSPYSIYPIGTYVSTDANETTDRTCTACAEGTYSATQNAASCSTWSHCNAGDYVSTSGTTASDRSCSPCAEGSYSSTLNAGSCSAWSTCTQGTFVTAPGTTTSDQTCAMCPAGTYSDALNTQSCTNCPTGTTSPAGSTSAAACL